MEPSLPWLAAASVITESLRLNEPEAPAILLYRRDPDGPVRETYEGLDAVIDLPEVGVSLSLSEVFEDLSFGV
ncbi:MAG: hypothetical protein AAF514_18225 [Verrucomicrobiota bacterium]